MIDIDGSFGEGGGQIVRTSVALSAVTGIAVKIRNIRQKRSNSGLAPQHAQAIKTLAQLSNAKIIGVRPGSSEINFEPGNIRCGHIRADIGTAGSVTLLMQCLLPVMLGAEGSISIEVHGGTDVKWSPTIDYFKHVFLAALNLFGARARVEIWQRGYYPRGMGAVLLEVHPGPLHSAEIRTQEISVVEGISHSSNLSGHVAQRQADSASQVLNEASFETRIITEALHLPSTGSGITLWSIRKGGSALGERGIRAEKVGKMAADEMILEMRSQAAVDKYLADQLIPYLAMAGGSYSTREVSMHTKTNIWTARHFFDKNFQIYGDTNFIIEAY